MKLSVLLRYKTKEGSKAKTQACEIDKDYCLIGRKDSDVNLGDPHASKHHAVIYQDDKGRLCIRDLQSRNGTFVNGKRKNHSYIKQGSEFRIGNIQVTVLSFRPSEVTLSGLKRDSLTSTGFIVNKIPQNLVSFSDKVQSEFAHLFKE